MPEIKLKRRYKTAGDVMNALVEKAGMDLLQAVAFMAEIPDADVVPRSEFEALIADIRAFTKQWYLEDNGFPCRFCKFSVGGGCTNEERQKTESMCAGQFFEWRGIEGKDGDPNGPV